MSSKIGVISLVEGEVKTSVHSNTVRVGGELGQPSRPGLGLLQLASLQVSRTSSALAHAASHILGTKASYKAT